MFNQKLAVGLQSKPNQSRWKCRASMLVITRLHTDFKLFGILRLKYTIPNFALSSIRTPFVVMGKKRNRSCTLDKWDDWLRWKHGPEGRPPPSFPTGRKINVSLEASHHWTWVAKRPSPEAILWKKQFRAWRALEEDLRELEGDIAAIVVDSDTDISSDHDGP